MSIFFILYKFCLFSFVKKIIFVILYLCMDRKKLLILRFFLNNCEEGYKIFETNKLFGIVKKYKGDYELLEKDIQYLSRMNYIDLKYMDKDNVCLCIKDNSRILQENLKVEKSSKNQLVFYMFLTVILSGVMSFVGAMLANLIIR